LNINEVTRHNRCLFKHRDVYFCEPLLFKTVGILFHGQTTSDIFKYPQLFSSSIKSLIKLKS